MSNLVIHSKHTQFPMQTVGADRNQCKYFKSGNNTHTQTEKNDCNITALDLNKIKQNPFQNAITKCSLVVF